MKLSELKHKKVLILGLGIEGMDSLKFLRGVFPNKKIGLADRLGMGKLDEKTRKIIKNDKNLELHLGENYLEALKNYDVIIKSPGIPLKTIEPFLTKGQVVTSRTRIFFDNAKGKIIGITGTKGKSTTTSLIYEILKNNKIRAYLAGNIGEPMLSYLLKDKESNVYIAELSSYQLEDLKKSPHIAVFLNLYSEHLDRHESFEKYALAKSNIAKHQTKNDYLVFNSKDKLVNDIAKKSKAKNIAIDSVRIEKFQTNLQGEFNLKNIKAAVAVARLFNIKENDIIKAVKEFKPLEHRLEYVGKYKGIEFYNDALSTIPEATMAALDTLGNRVETIFLGGFDRGLDFKELAKRILKSKIKTLILFQTTGDKIYKEIINLDSKANYKAIMVQNMEDGVEQAFKYTSKGKICLLSTASPSFSLFKDYREKGNLFKKYVKLYGKE